MNFTISSTSTVYCLFNPSKPVYFVDQSINENQPPQIHVQYQI